MGTAWTGRAPCRCRYCLLLILLCLPAGFAAADSALRDHPSPYLAMHADDPVQWRLWGPAVLAEAKRSGRLIFISSGYFACHWCHVMQRESFRNADIAALLNRHFIPVKIDREQLPALDGMLMEFARRTRGRAGWPLNVLLTPAGDPLFASLYAPPAEFLTTLKDLQARWQAQGETLTRMAAAGRRAMHAEPIQRPGTDKPAPLDRQTLHARLLAQARAEADEIGGGFGEQSKFPHAPWLLALLGAEAFTHDDALTGFLHTTLTQMAALGLRDQLGGGFFRYTVDPHWRQPHFEKMLYDNAQLALVYLRAARLFDAPRYAQIGFETLDFIQREMCTADGLCASSLSAVDEHGVEGGYYLWSEQDLADVFADRDLLLARDYWQLHLANDFEAGALPIPVNDPAGLGDTYAMSPTDLPARLSQLRARLLEQRRQRSLPIDSKQLCGWNGLLLAALSDAAGSKGGERFAARAKSIYTAISRRCFDKDGVLHSAMPRTMAGETTLDDMGQMAFGLFAYATLAPSPAVRADLRRVLDQAWSEFATQRAWRSTSASLIDYGPPQALVADSEVISAAALILAASRWLADETEDGALRAKVAAARDWDVLSLQRAPLRYASMVALYFRE